VAEQRTTPVTIMFGLRRKMLFMYPMWDHESQRIGKQKCTPLGYKLHGMAEILGFIGFFVLLVTFAYCGYRRYVGTFHFSLLWLITVPFGTGLIGECLYHYSWKLAVKKGFQYNRETCEASWMEGGQKRAYKWESRHTSERIVANPAKPSK